MAPQHHTRNGLGRPLPSVELKLVAGPNESAEKSKGVYRGRIHIRGPSISLVKTPRIRTGVNVGLTLATQLSSEEEWINTNRIGEWNIHKQDFRVLDNLVEPLGERYLGDYVPVERLEATYKKVRYVFECVLLHSWKCVDLIGIICMRSIHTKRHMADQNRCERNCTPSVCRGYDESPTRRACGGQVGELPTIEAGDCQGSQGAWKEKRFGGVRACAWSGDDI
jgi:hypothetical protein